TIVWRNRDDLDTMSLDDVYNHLKVYEPEVQKKSKSNSQDMAFISSSNTSSGKGEVYTTSVLTASFQVFTSSTDIAAASLSHDTNEHYALWEVIEFDDSYKAPLEESGKGPASESSAKKKGRIVVITTEDM
nr:ribonuclease H-like domain-containing protein [Tanacetum cinerariifolium]